MHTREHLTAWITGRETAPHRKEITMIKLNRPVDLLETILEKIEAKIEELTEKMDALEDHACDLDRDLTAAEQNRFDKYESQIEELQEEADEIENALDYLREYSD